jgi:hypothetical protein
MGNRYFARTIRNPQEFEYVMDYIDQNPVKVGLAVNPADWKASEAYYKAQNIPGLVDFSLTERLYKIAQNIPKIGDTENLLEPPIFTYITLRNSGLFYLRI